MRPSLPGVPKWLPAVAVVLTIASGPLFAQANVTGVVKGYVTDSFGNFVPGASMTLRSPSLVSGSRELLTDAEGFFIISDLRMPGMGGEALYESVLAISPALARRIIFSTGDVASEGTREFLQRTGNPYLQKPFELSAMRRIVAQMTARTH